MIFDKNWVIAVSIVASSVIGCQVAERGPTGDRDSPVDLEYPVDLDSPPGPDFILNRITDWAGLRSKRFELPQFIGKTPFKTKTKAKPEQKPEKKSVKRSTSTSQGRSAPSCKKGKRCGNSCIARNKTCRK